MTWLREWSMVPAVLLGMVGVLILVLNRRMLILFLVSSQYLLSAWLMLGVAQLESAGALLLAGLLAVFMLFLSLRLTHFSIREAHDSAFPSNLVFRISVGFLGVLASVGALRAQIVQFSALDPMYVLGGILTMILGLMQLSLTRSHFRIAIGLLGTLTGFSTLYIAVEPSLAVVALLALVHLGVALTCSYILLQSTGQGTPENPTP
jgi:hypothetical protein